MKKYMMLTAAAVLVLVSCAQIETNDRPGTTKAPAIGFSSYTPTSLTRANDTFIDGTALASGKQFAVYAWQTDFGTFLPVNPGVPEFMNPAVVTWNNDGDSGSTNGYEPKRYWPSGDEPDNLSFIAYYPYGGAGITPPTFGSGTEPFVPSGVGTYAFSAAGTSAAMVDFCLSEVVNDQVYGYTNKTASGYKGTVNFSFHHMLTKVVFRFKTNNTDANTQVKLVEAQLKNIRTTGTLKATFAQHLEETPADPEHPAVDLGVNKLGTTSMVWEDQAIAASPVTYDVTLNNSDPKAGTNEIAANEIPLGTALNTVHNNDIFLMVPQDMVPSVDDVTGDPNDDAQYLEVTWKVITDGVTTTNTKKLYLGDCILYTSSVNPEALADNDWTMNSAITYTITIGPQPIYFTGTATSWAAEQNGYFNP